MHAAWDSAADCTVSPETTFSVRLDSAFTGCYLILLAEVPQVGDIRPVDNILLRCKYNWLSKLKELASLSCDIWRVLEA
jgi:hypothetical protein